MLQSNQKTSLLVPYQLPKFISENEDYGKFVLFLQAYYEWMEQNGNPIDVAKNLFNYMDVDTTTQEFLNYFVNDFMSYFPQDILADKAKTIKIAKQLYQSKGTPASYEFLFRILFNSDVDFFYTKDAVLKPSSGKWYVPKSLKLATNDSNFLNIQNLRLFGNISKSIATVEAATYDGAKTEVFISNIERLFQSGETVTVVDSNNQPVYFLNGSIVPTGTVGAETLTALIVGQISQINIDPNNRGLSYSSGDPVVVNGGLNPNVAGPIGATAVVGAVTAGGIQRITVRTEGYGYTKSDANVIVGGANTEIVFTNLVGPTSTTLVASPIATVGTLDASGYDLVTKVPVDSIMYKASHLIGNIAGSSGANTRAVPTSGNYSSYLWSGMPYGFANNLNANANTTLANAFTFTSFATYPISSVVVEDQGSGMVVPPTVEALSLYNTDFAEPISGYAPSNLANLGILAPIQIIEPGQGYANGDTIVFLSGSGRGAYANVTVNTSGSIANVNYISNSSFIGPLGGMGYLTAIPIAVVANTSVGLISSSNTTTKVTGSANGDFTTTLANGSYLVTTTNVLVGQIDHIANSTTLYLTANASTNLTNTQFYKATAQLTVPGILGTGATFTEVLNRIGSVTTINIIDNGEDYVSAPNVSLAVQDMVVTNVAPTALPSSGDLIYQGANINAATYTATVDSIFVVAPDANPANSIYQLRVFNYTSIPVQNTAGVIIPLKIDSKSASMNLISGYNKQVNTKLTFDNLNTRFDAANGVITYGDGHAKATAKFLDGLVIGEGQYLDATGQPSAYDVLQSTKYNNYTYQITLSKEIEKYRDVLLNLLHPIGTQVLGRISMRSNNEFSYTTEDALYTGLPINDYTNTGVTAQILGGTANNTSNNIVTFNNLLGANLANIFVANTSVISFTYAQNYNDVVKSLVVKVGANSVTIQDNVFTYFANVAIGESVTGDNTNIYVVSTTGNYDIINNGNYSNPYYPLIDTIRVGDAVYMNNAYANVISVAPVVFTEQTDATGNVTTTTTSNVVIGNGTAFTSQLQTGTFLVTDQNIYLGVINEIANDTVLFLTANSSQAVVANNFFINTGSISDNFVGIVTLDKALTNGGNGYMSVSRTLQSIPGDIQIYGPQGVQYFLEMTDELGDVLTDEQGNAILIG